MSETSVQTSPKPAVDAPRPEPRPRSRKGPIRLFIEALASLKLTVVLLALSVVLVFCGTLAQVDHGIWAVVDLYFYSIFIWMPVQLFFPRTLHIPLWVGFPFPGGLTLGILLLTNLLAAHALRFRISWKHSDDPGVNALRIALAVLKKSGIILIHSGLIVLMVSLAVYHYWGVEGNMPIVGGGSANYVAENDRMELAVVKPIDKASEDLTAVPVSIMRRGGVIRYETLPFDVRVVNYMPNSDEPRAVKAGEPNLATAGFGLQDVAVPADEGKGVDPDQKVDMPTAYIDLKRKGTDESLGVYLVSAHFGPQTVDVDGTKYDISIRPHRDYKDYTVQLLEFKHEVYPGTMVPKNFSSRVRLLDPKDKVDREVLIYMNAPLRYKGETFYQAGFLPGDQGTILQVVRNPGWLLPYVACGMVVVGLLIHFGQHLVGFLRKKAVAS
jgi:hypothetical protein